MQIKKDERNEIKSTSHSRYRCNRKQESVYYGRTMYRLYLGT